jgi:SAM-dependent methyltransferase
MSLLDLFKDSDAEDSPWRGEYKIPWHEPGFSRRMLQEHLSQDHDKASRRQELIDQHVKWLQQAILKERTSRILDLGCGPGFYCERLAALGHKCRGIDISPAAIEYAHDNSKAGTSCEYVLGNMLTVEYGKGYDVAMFIYGEFNVFPRPEAAEILKKMWASLCPGGRLLIETHSYRVVKCIGQSANFWYLESSGLFSERPHLCLVSNHWLESEQVSQTDFFVIDAETGAVSKYKNSLQAYTTESYTDMLQAAGFSQVECIPAWGASGNAEDHDLLMLLARRSS